LKLYGYLIIYPFSLFARSGKYCKNSRVKTLLSWSVMVANSKACNDLTNHRK